MKRPIHDFHPLSILLYATALLVCSLYYNHPVLLIIMLGCIILAHGTAGALRQGKIFLTMGLIAAGFCIGLNIFVNPLGEHVILTLPSFLFFSERPLTWEAFCFGVNMAIKLLLTIGVFSLYHAIMSPDRSLTYFLRFAPKTSVTAILTMVFLPRLQNDLGRVTQVMTARGATLRSGSWIERVRSASPLWRILLMSALEGAWITGEALHARAFGSGKRSLYISHAWRSRDTVLTLFTFLTGMLCGLSMNENWGRYDFYPTFAPLYLTSVFKLSIPIALCFLALPVLHWAWSCFSCLKSKT